MGHPLADTAFCLSTGDKPRTEAVSPFPSCKRTLMGSAGHVNHLFIIRVLATEAGVSCVNHTEGHAVSPFCFCVHPV